MAASGTENRTRYEALSWLTAAALLLAVGAARAQDDKPAPKPPAAKPAQKSAAPECSKTCVVSRSALETVVVGIAAGVGKAPPTAKVFVGPLVSDAEAPKGDALLAKIAEHVAGRLGPEIGFEGKPTSRADARRAARDLHGFLFLDVAISGGRLRVTADAYPVPRTVWARARASEPGPVAHAQAHAPIDAEIRSYLEPLSFEAKPTISKYQGADPEILALACGDLDGDGGAELVTMTRQRVLNVRLKDDKVVRVDEAKWQDLAPIAPVPLREPFGFATIVEGGGYLDLSITDRAGSVRLDSALTLVKKMKGKAVPHGGLTACAGIGQLLLGRTMRPCGDDQAKPDLPDVRDKTDAIASAFVVGKDGKGETTVALRRESMLVLRDADEGKLVARVGAQLAMGDIDQDGAPEVVSTIDTLNAKLDAVEVRTVHRTGTVKRRMKLPAPHGVRAVAVCPPDGPTRAPIVVATGTEIWVVR